MKHLPPEILVTARMNLLSLVEERCPSCPEVIIPPGGEEEYDIFRCRAAHGKHCVVAINTRRCVKNRTGEEEESPARDQGT
jgi:hypothetical protein